MNRNQTKFQICVDESSVPPVYGIACVDGEKAERLSTDFYEVERLVSACNRNDLSPCHLWDLVEDFRHS